MFRVTFAKRYTVSTYNKEQFESDTLFISP